MNESNREESWVQRLSSPDEQQRDTAITELRNYLSRALKRTLTNRYGSQLQIDDVIQDATLKILDSLDQFSGKSQFLTWAVTIATRVGLTELRRSRYNDISLHSDSGNILQLDRGASAPSVADQFDRSEILKHLERLIASDLTDKQRVAIRALLDNLPAEEIASRLGSNRNAVYKLMHNARARLRDALAEAGITSDDIQAVFA